MPGVVEFAGDAKAEDYAFHLPCVYADGVMSHAWAPDTAKFYLYRIDSPPLGTDGAASSPFLQVVMPISGFAGSVQFMVRRLAALKSHPELRKQSLMEVKTLCEEALRE